MSSERVDFGGDAREGDTEIKGVSLVGSNKVLDKQLPGPECHFGAEGTWVGSRIQGILSWFQGPGPKKKLDCQL